MPSTQKIERVAELKEQIESSSALLLTEYRGLTVSEITELRRSLGEGGARFAVIKNTLMRRALEDTDAAGLGSMLKGGFVEGRVLSADEARSLAELESREMMLSKVAGLMKGEMSRAASMFQAAQSRFLSLLEAFKAKRAEAAPDAEAAPEANGTNDEEGE